MIKITKFIFLFMLTSVLIGCKDDNKKCIRILDGNNAYIDPVRVYVLNKKEYLAEITETEQLILDDGKGAYIGETKNGNICVISKDGFFFDKVYKITAPRFSYENAIQYFDGFEEIPSLIIFRKKQKTLKGD